jgi:hypothetical protein
VKRDQFERGGNWRGVSYEICLERGPTGDDERSKDAIRAPWSRPEIGGPWRERSDVGSEPVGPSAEAELKILYGFRVLDDGGEVGYISFLIRNPCESDWLDISIPTEVLVHRYPVTYPLDLETNSWLAEVDAALARVGAGIYDVAPFRLGVTGEEGSGSRCAAELTAEDCERGGLVLPTPLWRRLAPKREAVLISRDLVYVPFLGPHIAFGG